jgi:hypothetical protein
MIFKLYPLNLLKRWLAEKFNSFDLNFIESIGHRVAFTRFISLLVCWLGRVESFESYLAVGELPETDSRLESYLDGVCCSIVIDL